MFIVNIENGQNFTLEVIQNFTLEVSLQIHILSTQIRINFSLEVSTSNPSTISKASLCSSSQWQKMMFGEEFRCLFGDLKYNKLCSQYM